jgi:hypothetical protein
VTGVRPFHLYAICIWSQFKTAVPIQSGCSRAFPFVRHLYPATQVMVVPVRDLARLTCFCICLPIAINEIPDGRALSLWAKAPQRGTAWAQKKGSNYNAVMPEFGETLAVAESAKLLPNYAHAAVIRRSRRDAHTNTQRRCGRQLGEPDARLQADPSEPEGSRQNVG